MRCKPSAPGAVFWQECAAGVTTHYQSMTVLTCVGELVCNEGLRAELHQHDWAPVFAGVLGQVRELPQDAAAARPRLRARRRSDDMVTGAAGRHDISNTNRGFAPVAARLHPTQDTKSC